MKNFVLKSFFLIIVLFIGILIGMNKANQGMMEMRGYTDHSFQTPIVVQKTEEGLVETTFLGNDLPSFNLDEKREKIEEAKAFNFFSEAGKFVAEVISSIAQGIIDFFASFIP